MALDLNDMDTRVIEFHLRNGTLTEEEVAAHLEKQEDVAEHADESVTRFASSYADRSSD